MALTPERINELKEHAVGAWRAAGFEPMLQVFVAHAIATEVRKSDEALILQLVDALENSSPHTDRSFAWKDGKWQNQRTAAITAARARLESKP